MLSTLTEDGFGEDRTGGTSTAGCLRFTDALLRLKYSDAEEDDEAAAPAPALEVPQSSVFPPRYPSSDEDDV